MKQQLTLENKNDIRDRLADYVRRYPSQNKAANSLKGTSAGTVNSILNSKFDNISDEMFLNILSQVDSLRFDDWVLCNTTAYQELITLLHDAQEYQNVAWVVGPAGIGKTTAVRQYGRDHQDVFILPCSEDMHKADFVHELAQRIGCRTEGQTVRETLATITRELVTMNKPLLVFDEGDKLTDSVMYYFISLYNALEDKCGIIFLSTPYIKKRMERGMRLCKKGYDEIDSRICRRYIDLTAVTPYEVNSICRANGLTDPDAIGEVIKDSASCNYDLRRVKKATHKQKRILANQKL